MARKFIHFALAAACGLAALPAGAVSLGLVSDFEDGSTQGWNNGGGNPSPPLNIASGGPAGSDDAYLLTTSTGIAGPGGRLVLISGPGWAGNYPLAGVTGIAMDLNNTGNTTLNLRLLIEGPPGVNAWSSAPVVLNSGSGWTHVTFATEPGAFNGQGAAALGAATQLRLYHGTAAVFPGENMAASLALDNITAVPEAGSAAMLLAGLAALGLRRLRKR